MMSIMSFDYPSGLIPIKKKQDMIRGLIEKTRASLWFRAVNSESMIKLVNSMGSWIKSMKKRTTERKKHIDNDEEDIDIDKVW